MPETYDTLIATAVAALGRAKAALADEMAGYPGPISGCDAQYTRMIADRTRITRALAALERAPFVPTPRVLEPGARVESR